MCRGSVCSVHNSWVTVYVVLLSRLTSWWCVYVQPWRRGAAARSRRSSARTAPRCGWCRRRACPWPRRASGRPRPRPATNSDTSGDSCMWCRHGDHDALRPAARAALPRGPALPVRARRPRPRTPLRRRLPRR